MHGRFYGFDLKGNGRDSIMTNLLAAQFRRRYIQDVTEISELLEGDREGEGQQPTET